MAGPSMSTKLAPKQITADPAVAAVVVDAVDAAGPAVDAVVPVAAAADADTEIYLSIFPPLF